MNTRFLVMIAGAGAVLAAPAIAADDDASGHGPWQFRLRAIGVLPDGGGNTTIGGEPDPQDAVVPEFDITYFFYEEHRGRTDPRDVAA